jgi:hypothetical protein
MFGQSDNNNQVQNNSPDPAGTAPALPANPFGDSDAPVPAPAPSAPVSPSAPMANINPIVTPPEAPAPDTQAPAGSDDLLGLKQQALQSLQPLVNHLDQSPEEKFKTTMMLIQASDNSSLVKQAYEAANQITDEKARAQALLDVVNEINYFTHKDNEAKT